MLNHQSTSHPIELNDSDLDTVAAGDSLINVSDVNIPVNAGVAVAVLGAAGALATQPSTIFKPGG